MSAVDDWLSADDLDLEVLNDPAARRDLVELALIDALLPRMPAPDPSPRRLTRGQRLATIAGLAVIAAMIAAWLLRPGPRRSEDVVHVEDTPMQRIAATSRSMHILEPDWVAVDTRLGTLVLRPNTEAVVRAAPSALAIFIEIRSGEATFHGETLRAGTRIGFGDRTAVRRLGPTIVVEVLHRDARRLEARMPDGQHRNFVISPGVAIEAPADRGDTVQLILSPDEREVFYITPAR